MPRRSYLRGIVFMGYVKGDPAGQSSLFPPSLDELVADDHPVRVIAAFVEAVDLAVAGFERAEPAGTGRPAYDPADLLKLYLYGYLNRVRSSRRLEQECRRNVEVMWLLGRLAPDFKTIADFRRRNSLAFLQVCRGFVRFCARNQLLGGELVAIDGSKFKAVSSKRQVVTRRSLAEERQKIDARITHYLKSIDEADGQDGEGRIDRKSVAAAIDELKARKANADTAALLLDALDENQHVIGEPEARLMRSAQGQAVCYNVQTAVDAKHGLVVHHDVLSDHTDNAQLEPQAKAVKAVLGVDSLDVVADAGYSNGSQFVACEEAGIRPFVPPNRAPLRKAGAKHYTAEEFSYDPGTDTLRCPANKVLRLKQINRAENARIYEAQVADCTSCSQKNLCTNSKRRMISRHWHEDAFERMNARLAAAPEMMSKRRSIVEHPFGHLKCWVMGDGRLLLKGLSGARTEMAIAVLAVNLKRAMKILGHRPMIARLAG